MLFIVILFWRLLYFFSLPFLFISLRFDCIINEKENIKFLLSDSEKSKEFKIFLNSHWMTKIMIIYQTFILRSSYINILRINNNNTNEPFL